jgi:phage protein D
VLLDLLSGRNREPAGCVIKVGVAKREIRDLYSLLSEVRVEHGRLKPWTATLVFESRRDEKGQWKVQDAGVFKPWEPILIEASFGSTTEEVLRGYVREVEASYPQDPASATVVVRCQDASLALDREHKRKAWGDAKVPTSDSLILMDLLGKNNLAPDPKSGKGLSGLILYQDDTDLGFLRRRAEANGYELIFRDGFVYFGPMRLQGKPQATILVYAGPDSHCLDLKVTADGHLPEKVAYQVASASDTSAEEQIVTSDLPLLGKEPASGGGPGLKDFVWRLRRTGRASDEELHALALAKANELAMRVHAEGELDSTLYGHVLRVGETVPLDGVGERLNGLYYVDQVTHRFTPDGYTQTFRLLRNAYGDNVPGAAGALGALGAALGKI